MPISCVYCGASHDSGAQVRACWQRNGEPPSDLPHHGDAGREGEARREQAGAEQVGEADAATWSTPGSPTPGSPTTRSAIVRPAATPSAATRSAIVGPDVVVPVALGPLATLGGPDVLGRGLVVRRGAESSGCWASAPRVVVDATALARPDLLAAQLRAVDGRRVVEIDVDDALVDALGSLAERRPLHELGPEHVVHGDELQHLIFDNSIDARDPARPRWPLLEQALSLGARRPGPGEPGDVVGVDGIPRWLDGGPLRHRDPIDGVPVVSRIAVQHRSLVPFGPNGLGDGAVALAPDQLAAVLHTGGAARVIAPAGSGKTRVLTARARHVVDGWHLPATAVTVVAFNKRAQDEVQARLVTASGVARAAQPQVRTLNAIALAILNGSPPFAAQPRRLRTVDEAEVRRIIGRMVRFPRRRNADPVAPWIEALGLVRLGLRTPEQVEAMYGGDVDGFAATYPRYREALARDGLVDFDEQVHLAIELLLADPPTRARAQWACRVLLVDEFQDLTPAHLLLVRLLAGADGAVFGVGDDDQTIYGYNGADPGWLIDFARLFPTAGDHPLEVDYRCPGDVVELVDRLLRHNRRRVPKVIRSADPGRTGFRLVEAGSGTVAATVATVTAALSSGRAARDVAVLTRVNVTLAPVQIALGEAGVTVSGGVGADFLDRAGVRSTLAWLRLALGRWSPGDVAEALRRPSRSLHPNVATWVAEQTSLAGLERLAGRITNERDAQRIGDLAADIGRLQAAASQGAPTAELLAALHGSIGLERSVATLDASRRGMNRAAQHDDLAALTQIADLQRDPGAFEPWLRERIGRRPAQTADGVVLATVHRVKGQEWPLVVVHQADTDLFPHGLADDEEEERRLFHVALTRAVDEVVVVTGTQPSPFVAELTTEPAPAGPAPAVSAPGGLAPAPPIAPSRPATRARPAADDGIDAVLFERLRALRRELADGKPAYVVFDDQTLRSIAGARPASLRELAAIRGVGPAKLERYGQAFIDALAAG